MRGATMTNSKNDDKPTEPTNDELTESNLADRVTILETRIAQLQRLVFLMSGSLPSAVASEFPDEGEQTVYVQPPANV